MRIDKLLYLLNQSVGRESNAERMCWWATVRTSMLKNFTFVKLNFSLIFFLQRDLKSSLISIQAQITLTFGGEKSCTTKIAMILNE